MKEKNITPQKAYLKSLGKRIKDLTAAELKEYYRVANKWRYETSHRETMYEAKKELYLTRSAERYSDGKFNRLRVWFNINKKRGHGGTGTFEEVVGCTPDELKVHIESLFIEDMSWDNWGIGKGKSAWHIDHIDAVKDGGSHHYTNLQPLWAGDNLAKRYT